MPSGHRQAGERLRHGMPGKAAVVGSDTALIFACTPRCSWLTGERVDLAELLPNNEPSTAPAPIGCHRISKTHSPRRLPQTLEATPRQRVGSFKTIK